MPTEAEQWKALGLRLRVKREAMYGERSGRKTAGRLGIDPGYLRFLENGGRLVRGGAWELPPHTSARIATYALLLGEDPADVLAMVGRSYDPNSLRVEFDGVGQALEARVDSIEADLAAIRGEIGSLRTAVEDALGGGP